MAPAIFGVSVSQINLCWILFLRPSYLLAVFHGFTTQIDYRTAAGCIWYCCSHGYPTNLSRHHAGQSNQAFSETLDWALKMILVVALPAAVALMLLAEPILVTLFYYGEVMTLRDMAMASLSLKAYAAGLIAFMLIKVLRPVCPSGYETPVRIGVIAMVLNMLFNLLLVIPCINIGKSVILGWRQQLLYRHLSMQYCYLSVCAKSYLSAL